MKALDYIPVNAWLAVGAGAAVLYLASKLPTPKEAATATAEYVGDAVVKPNNNFYDVINGIASEQAGEPVIVRRSAIDELKDIFNIGAGDNPL